MNETSLILQGGGMRGVYTAGVLDYFLEKDLHFPYVIAVSAGACNGCTYVAQQRGLAKKLYIDYVTDPKFSGYRNLIKNGSLFGMNYIFDEMARRINPIDFDSLSRADTKFLITVTDCATGKAMYIDKQNCTEDVDNLLKAVRASSSIPFVSPMVKYQNKKLLDGGISDPIPIKKSMEDGNNKHVVVMTGDSIHTRGIIRLRYLAKRTYGQYPRLASSILRCTNTYNSSIKEVEKLKNQDKAFVIEPSHHLRIKFVEKNQQKLSDLYSLGYNDAKQNFHKLKDWLEK